jgi:ribose-phosphate pyrophosphokinase
LIVDDLASTGRTLAGAAAALQQAGAREIHALFTHPVMAPGAWERLLAAPLGRIVTSDSLPIQPHPRLEIVRIAPLLARTVRYLAGEVL